VPTTDNLIWLLAGLGLGLFLAMLVLAAMVAVDRRRLRRRVLARARSALMADVAKASATPTVVPTETDDTAMPAVEAPKPLVVAPTLAPPSAPKPVPAPAPSRAFVEAATAANPASAAAEDFVGPRLPSPQRTVENASRAPVLPSLPEASSDAPPAEKPRWKPTPFPPPEPDKAKPATPAKPDAPVPEAERPNLNVEELFAKAFAAPASPPAPAKPDGEPQP
jgi:DedD protein